MGNCFGKHFTNSFDPLNGDEGQALGDIFLLYMSLCDVTGAEGKPDEELEQQQTGYNIIMRNVYGNCVENLNFKFNLNKYR